MEWSSYSEESVQPDFLHSVNDRMLHIRERLVEVAATHVPVLLIGEKGLGKEALAHTIHRWSPRAAGPFVRVNCAIAPAVQLETDLFADSRADSRESVTAFVLARGGTLCLAGVETFEAALCARLVPIFAQSKPEPPDAAARLVLVIEVIEGGEAVPEGPVEKLVRAVVDRSSGVAVTLPPLRERPEDIGLLAQQLLQLHSPFYSSRIKQVRSSLIDLFKQYAWPGNVRELERVVRRFLVLEDESAIRRELEEKIGKGSPPSASELEPCPHGLTLGEIGKLAAHKAEARAIRRVLEQTRWNKKAAAQELGVSYKSLLNKVRDYQLDS